MLSLQAGEDILHQVSTYNYDSTEKLCCSTFRAAIYHTQGYYILAPKKAIQFWHPGRQQVLWIKPKPKDFLSTPILLAFVKKLASPLAQQNKGLAGEHSAHPGHVSIGKGVGEKRVCTRSLESLEFIKIRDRDALLGHTVHPHAKCTLINDPKVWVSVIFLRETIPQANKSHH